MTRHEEKAQLRTIVRKLEQSLSPKYKKKSSHTIAQRLLSISEYQSAQTVFCFVGTEKEVDTMPILRHALETGKTLCVPRCNPDHTFSLHQITDLADLTPGAYGILEPADTTSLVDIDQVDFAILPCLTCNHGGQRLGQGGGYYDRFLSHYRGGSVLLCREKLIREEIPVEPHDYPIPWVLTEIGLFEDGTPAYLG